ncbi:TonB-dependent receptor [Flexithrix dorotheae]|uniref:TonB-dependent receptor n=1 Tax=Flexithrix dorotheae TaxID=70993 RepID=UPI000369BEC9|nr:TonB-dependent receptor [Flexithrix dorotheae]
MYIFFQKLVQPLSLFYPAFIFCILSCILPSIGYTQDILDKEISIDWNNISYQEAIEDINHKNGITFIYSADYLPTQRITLKLDHQTLRLILTEMFLSTNISYQVFANEIVLSNQPKKTKKYILNGKITDSSTGEELIGVNIWVKSLNSGASSNSYGFYSLPLPEGVYELQISYLGFKVFQKKVGLNRNQRLDFALEPYETQLEEITVTGKTHFENRNVEKLQMSSFSLSAKEIKQVPSLMGENDVIKTIQLLPGVQSGNEGSVGFFVRGGGADQNLILIDEAPVLNPSHFYGIFSIFNPAIIKDVEFSKGGISSKYGGRLSSVLDVRLKEGNYKKFGFSGGIGSISTNLLIEGPINKGKGSYVFAGRRTYADLLVKSIPNQNISGNSLYFYDFNGKIDYKFNQKNKVSISSYFGNDKFGFQDFYGVNWGNQTISARWNHIFSPKLFSNLTLYTSFFRTKSLVNLVENFGYRTKYNVRNIGAKYNFSYYINAKNFLDFGIDLNHHRYFFGEIVPLIKNSVINEEFIEPSYGIESGVYLSYTTELASKVGVNIGLRYSRFDNKGPGIGYIYDTEDVISPETSVNNIVDSVFYERKDYYNFYHGLEPRLSVRYLIDEQHAIKLSYNRTRQYVHQLSNTNVPSPIDMWAPVNKYIKPQIADQVALGLFRNFGGNMYEASIEAYYKLMQNQIDFKPLANLLLNNHLETEILSGNGKSMGLEFFLKKNKGKFTGWLSYTHSKAEREIFGINGNLPYPTSFDRLHDFSIFTNYRPNNFINISANWNYSSGQAYTFPVGKYEKDGFIVPFYTSRNGFRLPSVHRLDLSITFYRRMSPEHKNESSFNFSIYNVYNRKNTYAYIFRQSEVDRTKTEAVKLYLFTILPSFTYNFKF